MNILLAVDGSSYSKKMLAYLSTHEALFSPAHAYTVFNAQSALPPRVRATVGKDIVDSYYAEEAAKVLTPIRKFLTRHGIRATLDWKVGPVGAQIAKLADSGAFDLLVMGSHGHGALANLMVGSVTTQVLARCTTPVLVAR